MLGITALSPRMVSRVRLCLDNRFVQWPNQSKPSVMVHRRPYYHSQPVRSRNNRNPYTDHPLHHRWHIHDRTAPRAIATAISRLSTTVVGRVKYFCIIMRSSWRLTLLLYRFVLLIYSKIYYHKSNIIFCLIFIDYCLKEIIKICIWIKICVRII